ncbi:MAG: sensor histidine kinase [Acidimicrobiales bacterium]
MSWPPGLLRVPRRQVMRAARVAAVVTVVIGLVFVAVAAGLDAFLARRVLWEVDQSLTARLVDVGRSPTPLAVQPVPDDQGSDGAPVFMWWLPPDGPPARLTADGPPLPAGGRAATAGPVSARGGAVTYRLVATPLDGGWLLAGQNLAGPSHIEGVLRNGELVIGPVLLVAVFVGSLVIGLQAVAPVELARRRLLEFTADASHELRTPLTVIEAEIELARGGPPDADADRQALDHVARESRRLKQIVEDLLWLARSDSAPPAPAGAPADLVAVVEGCAERFTAVASGRGIDLGVSHLGGAAWVDAAPEWVDRLAGTLLDNACRYAPDGGVVRVSVGAGGSRAVLRVEDSGPGIPPAARERLFDRFRRATDVPGGAGLGLAIADSVVRSTGGRWRVADSALGGALMEVTWRRSAAPGRPGPGSPRPQGGGAEPSDLPSTVGP